MDGRPRIPPPILFLSSIFLSIFVDSVLPISVDWLPITTTRLLGLFVILATALHMWVTFRTFHKFDAPDSGRPLITEGPYRYTRNPMYLSGAMLQIGLAIFLRSAWMIVFFVLALAVVTIFIVIPEERDLEDRFGEAYREYRRQVRRWI